MGYETFITRALQRRCLLAVNIELTTRCNLSCVHCYQYGVKPADLEYSAVCDILTAAVDLGCYHVTFTGGEPFVREDIWDILREVRRLTYSFSIMTNGMALTGDGIRKLKRLNVTNLEVSLLGVSASVYRDITGNADGYSRVIETLERLDEHNIGYIVKTPVIKRNADELEAIYQWGEETGRQVHFSPYIMPGTVNYAAPCAERLDDDMLKKVYRFLLIHGVLDPQRLGSIQCSIGKITCYITACGEVYPCVNYPRSIGAVNETSLGEIWGQPETWMSVCRLHEHTLAQCEKCRYREYCQRCPGLSYKETGDFNSISAETCRHARVIYEIVNET